MNVILIPSLILSEAPVILSEAKDLCFEDSLEDKSASQDDGATCAPVAHKLKSRDRIALGYRLSYKTVFHYAAPGLTLSVGSRWLVFFRFQHVVLDFFKRLTGELQVV